MTRKKNDRPVTRCLYPVIIFLFAMTAVSGAWVDSEALPKPAFDYVSAKWESSTTCLTVGNSAKASAVLRSTDSGHTWTDVTNNVAMQNFLLTDIAAGPSNAYVVTGRSADTNDGVVYTSSDGKTFSVSLKSAGAGLNGAAVGSNFEAFVVGVGGKIYRSVSGLNRKLVMSDTESNDITSWEDISLTTMTVMCSSTCCTTFI